MKRICSIVDKFTVLADRVPRRKPKRSGFTLIELLVSIGILFVLTTLGLYAVHRGRQRAQATRCGNNLRQIGLSAMMYFIDYDIPAEIRWARRAPSASPWSGPVPTTVWPALLIAHPPDPLVLPVRDRGGDVTPPLPPPPLPAPSPVFPFATGAGAIDAFGLLQKGCPGYGVNPAHALDPDNEPPFRSYGILQHNLGRKLDDVFAWLFACSSYAEIVHPNELAGDRHYGHVNVFFSDGHCRFMAVEDVLFPEDS